MRRSLRWAIASSTLSLFAGCGDEDPPELVGDDFYPVTVGTRWEYDDIDVAGDVRERLFKSMTDCEEKTFDDCATGEPITVQTVVQSSTGSNNPEEAGSTFLIRLDDGFYRIRQEVQDAGEPEPEIVRTYSPGFFRFPRGRLTLGTQWTSQHRRCEDDTTVDPPTYVETDKSYEWLLEDVETITVEAGTFEGAVKVRRVTVGSGETKLYWFARGVGKVLEQEVAGETVVREERLVSWDIGVEECSL